MTMVTCALREFIHGIQELTKGLVKMWKAMLAGAFANKDYEKATATASRVLQMGLVLGAALAFVLGTGLHFGAKVFTKDANVLHLIRIGITIVVLTQPLNSLTFVFDGVNFGASNFAYSAFSMHHNEQLALMQIFVSNYLVLTK